MAQDVDQCRLCPRFHIALDPKRLVILGLMCMAGREKVKCEQHGPLGD